MKFTHPTLVTITAPTCSGKSYLLNKLTNRGIFERVVSTTTRTPRQGEQEGIDYYFISPTDSRDMEKAGAFFELIEFNGIRYGVTNSEMKRVMSGGKPPVVILEPNGLEIYQRKCAENGWDIFKIYVHVVESLRLERLLQRTVSSAWAAVDSMGPDPSRYGWAFSEVAKDEAKKNIGQAVTEHQKRLLSIIGDERGWSHRFNWDAIIPGDDVEKAIGMIERGIQWRNRRLEEPRPY